MIIAHNKEESEERAKGKGKEGQEEED